MEMKKWKFRRPGAITSAFILLLVVGITALWIAVVSQAVTDVYNETVAKVYPGSADYPTEKDWRRFNSSIQGRLIAGQAPGHICFRKHSKNATCNAIYSGPSLSKAVLEDPTAVRSQWWSNTVCEHATKKHSTDSKCALGNYPDWVVKAETVDDVQKAVRFAATHRLRLTVKGTGQDFSGRSVGYGSLSIWTRHLKGVKVSSNWAPGKLLGKAIPHIPIANQTSEMFMGNLSLTHLKQEKGVHAVTISAGETFDEATSVISQHNRVITNSEEGSIGAVGGFVLGGGYGPLSNHLGLAVDNVVEHEIVLPDGRVVIANEKSYPDLFWALRGGGGGTFGIVTKVTVKTYPRMIMPGFFMKMSCNATTPDDNEIFLDIVAYFLTRMPDFSDFGVTGFPILTNSTFSGEFLAPGRTKKEMDKFLKPIWEEIRERGANLDIDPLDANKHRPKPADVVGASTTMSSRLIGRKTLLDFDKVRNLLESLENVDISQPLPVLGGQVGRNLNLNTSVHPAWRHAALHWIINEKRDVQSSVADMQKLYRSFTETEARSLDAASYHSASYMNEANPYENNWQRVFWGSNYKKLLHVKHQYDPDNVFWCRQCVGSEAFREGKDSRLYKQSH